MSAVKTISAPRWLEFDGKGYPQTKDDSTTSDDYGSDLPPFFRDVAKEQLREDEEMKKHSLSQFRDWISQNPDIRNIRTDSNFLLRFLRKKKYSLPLAENMLLKYLNLRKLFPSYFYNLDFLSPSINQLINDGYLVPSPNRDKLGRRIIFGFSSRLDPKKITNIDLAKIHILTYEAILCDEETQVTGVVSFGDITDASASFLTFYTPNEFFQLLRFGEHSMPLRHKEIHLVNVPKPFLYVYDFFCSTLTEKMRTRLFLHGSEEDIASYIDPSLLPKEYGGVMPLDEMKELWKEELMRKRDQLLALDKMELLNDRDVCLRKNKKPISKELNNDMLNVTGSFRKLNLD